MMQAVSRLDIDALECYHSLAWDRDLVLDVALENPSVEFWSVHAPYGKYCDPSSPLERAREGALAGFLDTIAVAARLGAKIVIAHPGINIEYDWPRNKRIDMVVDVFRQVADTAGEQGISIAVEPLPKKEIGSTLEELLHVVEMVDRPNVGVNFDVNHLFPPEAIPGMIRKAGSRILSVHISDQDGIERHWLPFQGTMDWREVLKALVDIGYTGPLIYETHIHDARDCDEAGRIIVDNYRRLIQLA
jgi:sugar phosphate isomerase/epimerase